MCYTTKELECLKIIRRQKWYKLSAEHGDAVAQFNLGGMYENGFGVQQDYKQAVKWHKLSAEQGDAKAQFNLGLLYYKGIGVPQDLSKQ